MEKKILVLAVNLLKQAFPNREFNTPIMWELLQDIGDEHFIEAIKDFCLTQREIYPDTNIIALIRDNAKRIKNLRSINNDGKYYVDKETYKKIMDLQGGERMANDG